METRGCGGWERKSKGSTQGETEVSETSEAPAYSYIYHLGFILHPKMSDSIIPAWSWHSVEINIQCGYAICKFLLQLKL